MLTSEIFEFRSNRNLSSFNWWTGRAMDYVEDSIEWFVNMVDIGTYKIPDLQKQYAKLQDEVQIIDHQKVVSKAELG